MDYFDSAVVSVTLTRQWTKVATPVIVAPESFSGTKLSVSLTCATDGAVIRYTTDGSEPNSHSKKYTAPFDVTATTVIKAIALKTDCTTSDVATLTIFRQWGIGDALNDSDRSFTTDTGTGWVRDTLVSHDGSESMRSGLLRIVRQQVSTPSQPFQPPWTGGALFGSGGRRRAKRMRSTNGITVSSVLTG